VSYLLSIFIFSPILGILALLFVSNEKAAKSIGTVATLIPLACSFVLYSAYLSGKGFASFSQDAEWIQFGKFANAPKELFAIHYELGVDGFSFVMMMLTAVLGTLAAVAAHKITKQIKSF
jgi:NADH-quinone oxidoreductase subunit M